MADGSAAGPERDAVPDAADRTPDPAPGAGGGPPPDPPRCDLCGATMYERHCRIICARCGYQRDCSDP